MGKIALFFLLVVAGCAGPQPETPHTSGTSDAAFTQLTDEYLSGYLAWRPIQAMQLGLHEYDGKLTDFGMASVQAELARLKSFDRRLDAINPAALGTQSRYDYRILRAAVRKELFQFEDVRAYTRNPMTYALALDVSGYIKRTFAPLEQRTRSIIAILNEAPKVMAAGRANLDESLPKPYVETAILIADGTVAFLEKDLPDALKDLKDAPLRTEFAAANKRATEEVRNFAAYLKQDKLPKANAPFALGREKFIKMVREGELITLPPEKILEIGMAELHREQRLFAETAAKIDPARSPLEVFKEIQRDHPTAESLLPDVRKDLETIRQFVVAHNIVTIPSEVRPRVEETLQFERASSFASMDTPGPFETKATEAYYYVTPVEPDWTPQQKEEWLTAFNYYTTDVVSIHEAFPGHYVQFLCLNVSPATRLEKIFSSYAYVEGWAHYSEQMLIDEGFGADAPDSGTKAAKYRLAQLDEALLRLCRLCVSIQIHCQGMSVEDATKFFQANCYYEEKPAHSEAMRGTFDPGYLNYTLGKMMILKLRKDYRAQQGAEFSLKNFHDEMLRHGMPPVPLLREILLKDRATWREAL
ncbi:MAG TPA: DUF885 domain-containing protein [Verrucomicrobiae bacterium]|nr:DUF885 domain-containing protein [Verrucomicrobiae bacterium]